MIAFDEIRQEEGRNAGRVSISLLPSELSRLREAAAILGWHVSEVVRALLLRAVMRAVEDGIEASVDPGPLVSVREHEGRVVRTVLAMGNLRDALDAFALVYHGGNRSAAVRALAATVDSFLDEIDEALGALSDAAREVYEQWTGGWSE